MPFLDQLIMFVHSIVVYLRENPVAIITVVFGLLVIAATNLDRDLHQTALAMAALILIYDQFIKTYAR